MHTWEQLHATLATSRHGTHGESATLLPNYSPKLILKLKPFACRREAIAMENAAAFLMSPSHHNSRQELSLQVSKAART